MSFLAKNTIQYVIIIIDRQFSYFPGDSISLDFDKTVLVIS